MIEIAIHKPLSGANGAMQLNVNTTIESHSFVAITGKSGSGKTTLLRVLAGLEKAEGSICVDGEIWQDANTFIPPQKRQIGFVFQDYALFENMTVLENLLYVTKDTQLAHHLLELTQLTQLQNRHPHTLSGGQKQRVAIARAMMKKPKLLLLDEPLSALDSAMRATLQNELLTLHKEFGTTTLMVSHDPSEIYKMCAHVLVLENGAIIQSGAPKEVLLRMQGSQKFSFRGEIVAIERVDVLYVGIVAIGQQLVEVVLSHSQAQSLQTGDKVSLSTKAFAPVVKKDIGV